MPIFSSRGNILGGKSQRFLRDPRGFKGEIRMLSREKGKTGGNSKVALSACKSFAFRISPPGSSILMAPNYKPWIGHTSTRLLIPFLAVDKPIFIFVFRFPFEKSFRTNCSFTTNNENDRVLIKIRSLRFVKRRNYHYWRF